MGTDRQQITTGLNAPAFHATVVSPNDSLDLTYDTRGLYIGGDGDLKVTTAGGDVLTFYNATAGSIIPVRVIRVWSTGTSATNIIALW